MERVMNSGMLLLLFGTLFAIGECAVGFFVFSRADMLAAKNGKPPSSLRTLGRIQMIGGVVILIGVIAVAFGVIHPFPKIQPIQF
jgi:hypothetical protein